VNIDLPEAACRVAEHIASTATWSREECTWVGAPAIYTPGPWVDEAGSVGWTLYGGSAGVAWFLAHAAAANLGGPSVRTSAAGGLRHAFRALDRGAPSLGGFFTGSLGVVHTGFVVAELLGLPELAERAERELGKRLAADPSSSNDLVGGRADTLLGLTRCALGDHDSASLTRAIELGDDIIADGIPYRGGLAWPNEATPPEVPGLCGLAHGSAGIALALLELYCLSSEVRFRAAALRGLDYEATWFDTECRNWPDLRFGYDDSREPVYMWAWCHGAAGILLVHARAKRVCAYQGSERALDGVRSELLRQTHRESVDGRLGLALCHGLAGNTLIAHLTARGHTSAQPFDPKTAELAGLLARSVTSLALRPEYASPSLFRGLSGVGLALLALTNLAAPSIASVLGPATG
jgi:lantibiotic modifying enzyme